MAPLSSTQVNKLRYVRTLIAAGWCQGAFAITPRGRAIHAAAMLTKFRPAKYSLDGALHRVSDEEAVTFNCLHAYLRGRLPEKFATLEQFNDDATQTRDGLLEWLDASISMAGL